MIEKFQLMKARGSCPVEYKNSHHICIRLFHHQKQKEHELWPLVGGNNRMVKD